MSILLRLKNRLQDPSLYENKLREFDECMSFLKNENAELHKRIDQLEALYKTSMRTQQTHFLEEHVRQLEQENERLLVENQCQRQEYERFLDQLTTMVIRTAVMQEKIRKECVSIYHIIERLSMLTMNAFQTNHPFELIIKDRKKSLSWENLHKTCEFMTNYRKIPKLADSLKKSFSSSSNSSSLTQGSMSTSGSWTLDLALDRKIMQNHLLVSDQPTKEEPQPQVLQRSETYTISKTLQEEPSSCLPISLVNQNVQKNPVNRTIKSSALTNVRPSRLPSHISNSKAPNNRSSSTPKVSKLPIRTMNSSTQQQNSIKKSNIPTNTVIKVKNDSKSIANRSTPVKKTIQPPSASQLRSNKVQSRSSALPIKTNIKTPIETVKSVDPPIQMNSTSSDSSIEEQQQQQHRNKDDGYSTWSSIDVKDDGIVDNSKKNEVDSKQRNIGLVNNWLDTSKEQSTTISSSTKDISLDSLDSSQSKDQIIPASINISRSDTYDTVLITQALPSIVHDFNDSTSSTISTFNMSDYIEDNFIDPDDTNNSNASTSSSSSSSSSSRSDDSSSYETTIVNKHLSVKPQKRLLFPGLLNRLIFLRRVLSDSDLQQKQFCMSDNENQYHVYHSDIINEHSVEINLMNTYGSDSELHVWSHNCAEQRRFRHERQLQLQQEQPEQLKYTYPYEENRKSYDSYNQQLALERQILLQQIYEYPWLLQENDLDQTIVFSSENSEQRLTSPTSDLVVPTHNPDFYQLCTLTNSSSFVISYDANAKDTDSSTTSSVL